MESTKPDWPDVGEVYSNCDHTFDEQVVAELEKGNVTAGHSAWNFHGAIWKQDGKYFEEVKSYLRVVGLIEGTSLVDVVTKTIERFGRE